MTVKHKLKIICPVVICILSLMLAGCVSVEVGSPEKPRPPENIEPATDMPQQDTEDDSKTESESVSEYIGEWALYKESGGVASFDESDGKVRLHITDPGRVAHAVQISCGGFEMLEGGEYHFSAVMSSDVARTFEWRIQINGGDYHPYCRMENVEIGPEAKEITCDFTMKESSDPAPRMCFNLGDEGKEQGLSGHDIIIDKVTLILKNAQDAKPSTISGELMNVNINQIGYQTKADKRAVVRLERDLPLKFEVVDVNSSVSVYTGEVTEGIQGGSSGDTVGYADFSSLTEPGRYRIDVEGIGSSYEFSIGDDVFDDALSDSLRMLYLQRCGCELDESLAAEFAHSACHTEEARIYGGNRYIDVSGGWHDAGDYGRYTVPAAKTIADLLLAYELYPDAFSESINIPESGNAVPDILNEARYELDWLLKMQADDGGVYHKVTGLNFDGFIKADECTEDLYVLPESKTATADFAAVMYMASRVYADIDPEFSAGCKSAADRAIQAYLAHIDDRNFTNPSDVQTGEYGDGTSADEFLWAICEGYKTTGDRSLAKLFDKVDYSRIQVDGFGWADVSGYAYYAYLTTKDPVNIPFDVKGRFLGMCEELRDIALNKESYGSTFIDDYPWGSNMTIANNGMAFLMANILTGDNDYILAAQRQLDYLLGTNCTSYCFLTGYGTQFPEHPHHRPSEAVGKCMKGMLVGGPDSYLEDPYAKAVLTGLPKARCYADSEQTYSCNEITIYWNSPLVFLMAGLK